jgi:hypothetical protein
MYLFNPGRKEGRKEGRNKKIILQELDKVAVPPPFYLICILMILLDSLSWYKEYFLPRTGCLHYYFPLTKYYW